jgi:hypothetical protein
MKVTMDSILQENDIIPLISDGRAHEVIIELFTTSPVLNQSEFH